MELVGGALQRQLELRCKYAEENDAPRTRTRTFGEAGVLTSNKGLVVHIGDAEFQVTIVRSR